jgi:uncharacterized membrane protein YhaH (DUF805 family)
MSLAEKSYPARALYSTLDKTKVSVPLDIAGVSGKEKKMFEFLAHLATWTIAIGLAVVSKRLHDRTKTRRKPDEFKVQLSLPAILLWWAAVAIPAVALWADQGKHLYWVFDMAMIIIVMNIPLVEWV